MWYLSWNVLPVFSESLVEDKRKVNGISDLLFTFLGGVLLWSEILSIPEGPSAVYIRPLYLTLRLGIGLPAKRDVTFGKK